MVSPQRLGRAAEIIASAGSARNMGEEWNFIGGFRRGRRLVFDYQHGAGPVHLQRTMLGPGKDGEYVVSLLDVSHRQGKDIE
jgi:hypothetical protein